MRIPILKDKSIGLIKWQKAGLENLLVSTCIKRSIRRRAIRDYQMGEHQNPPTHSTLHLQLFRINWCKNWRLPFEGEHNKENIGLGYFKEI